MKRIYIVPDIEIVEFELKDIISASGLATGDDDSGRNDVSDGFFDDIWFDGRSVRYSSGGSTWTIGNGK